MKPLVSVIIPVYNEEKVINGCLKSLAGQSWQDLEVIVVDDGSSDATASQIQNSKFKIASRSFGTRNLILLKQNHLGPGAARNLGVSRAKGKILVFVDADMEFDRNFITKLIRPIITGETIGTFSKEEYLLNRENAWARCWNLNLGRPADRMHPHDYPDRQPVFRAILKGKFDEAGGFDEEVGYTDDWTISRRLGVLATLAPGAKYYHQNPETLTEVWRQARWFGKNEFLTKNLPRQFFNLCRYLPFLGLVKGLWGAVQFKEQRFLEFKIVYDTAVFISVLGSLVGESRIK